MMAKKICGAIVNPPAIVGSSLCTPLLAVVLVGSHRRWMGPGSHFSSGGSGVDLTHSAVSWLMYDMAQAWRCNLQYLAGNYLMVNTLPSVVLARPASGWPALTYIIY